MSALPNIRVFLSYHTNDKSKALTIKQELGKLGIEVFLAPDDVLGGSKFLEVLYREIKSREVFIALISKDYHTSEYSDQEIGIAVGSDRAIIPICIDNTIPYGFLRDYHCVCGANVSIENKIQELSDSILILTDSGKQYVDLLISNLQKAGSFEVATQWARNLMQVSKFTTDQIQKIVNARIHNDQIYNSFMARPIIDGILTKNKNFLSPEDLTYLEI